MQYDMRPTMGQALLTHISHLFDIVQITDVAGRNIVESTGNVCGRRRAVLVAKVNIISC